MIKINFLQLFLRAFLTIGCFLVSISLLAQRNIYGFEPPEGEINLFISLDENEGSQVYNSMTSRQQRDSLIKKRLDADWTHEIPPSLTPPYGWACGQYQSQLKTNSHDWGDGIFVIEEILLYEGYRGFDLDSIYLHGGTLKDIGKLGIPMCGVVISDPIVLTPAHAMTAILTGDDLTKFDSWNLIEPQLNTTNAVPGDFQNTHLPLNCEKVGIYYPYLTINEHGQKILNSVLIVQFQLVEGEPFLTYNVNDGTTPPNYTGNPHFDEIFHVIEKRDIAPPVLTVTSPVNDSLYTVEKPSLSYTINDDNFKSAWYSLDDGKTKTSLNKDGSIPLDLPNGNYTLMIQTEDHFRLTDAKSISFSVNILYAPSVSTVAVTDISENSARAGGNITSDGGADITARGLCWSRNETPTISDNVTNDGKGSGSFATLMTSLEPNTKYYYRAYATNSVGTGYGPILSFTTHTSDISDFIDNHLLIYPNPADDHITINLDDYACKECLIEIYNSSGRKLSTKRLNNCTHIDLSLTDLSTGIYYVQIHYDNKSLISGIVVR